MTLVGEITFGDVCAFTGQKDCLPIEACCFSFAEESLSFFDLVCAFDCDALACCIGNGDSSFGNSVGERAVGEEANGELFVAFFETVVSQSVREGEGAVF